MARRRRAPAAAALGLGVAWVLGAGRNFAIASHPVKAVREVWAGWLQKHGLPSPDDAWLDAALLWRAQRLCLAWPLHDKLVAPFLEGGDEEGNYDEMYARWRAAGVFDQMKSRAETSAEVDLKVKDDYDKMLSLWTSRLKMQPDTWPDDANTAVNFALTAYAKQMEDPSFFSDLREAIPLDEAKQQEVKTWEESVEPQLSQNQERFSLEKLKEFDSLFVGHSQFHVRSPYHLWQDASMALRETFPERCQRPLYNDIGNYHPEDLAANLLELDEAQLAKSVPLKHFNLVAAMHILPDEDGLSRLGRLLKPGGLLIWNTWWRREGEHPGGRPPNLTELGFEGLKDEVLPLSFVKSPFKQSGFQYRYCYTRRARAGKKKQRKGFR